tara:strand:+ start:4234 stop:4362 length:129 start_codon:yes stop_codon:yes gene_type:complete
MTRINFNSRRTLRAVSKHLETIGARGNLHHIGDQYEGGYISW